MLFLAIVAHTSKIGPHCPSFKFRSYEVNLEVLSKEREKNRFRLWYSAPIRLDGNSLSDSLTDVNSWEECKELKFVFCYSNRKSILRSNRHAFDKFKILAIYVVNSQ